MNRMWSNIIKPIIESVNANYIVEVGSDTGTNTQNILEYCMEHDAHMTAIDPFPNFNIDEFKSKYGNKFKIYEDFSLNILPTIENCDVILLDGDHNWYTVYNELKIIEKTFKKFPIVFLHNICWPFGRRDLYSNPENIPEIYRQPYKQLELYYSDQIDPNRSRGIDTNFYNSINEDNSQNGVLTAVEDFIDESDLKFTFKVINVFHGLGILYLTDSKTDAIIKNVINNQDLVEKLEEERINFIKKNYELENQNSLFQERLNKIELNLEQVKHQSEQKENQMRQLIQEKKDQIRISNQLIQKKETQLKELIFEIDSLKTDFHELEYLNNNYRSLGQRLASKFPSLYILFNHNQGLKNTLINIKGYKSIKKNHLLDIGYYLKNNEDVRKSGVDPILHYIYHGFKEGRKPNPSFDSNYYITTYADVKKSNLNPLIHYSLYGIKEKRKINSTIEIPIEINQEKSANLTKNIANTKIDIILCVHNALNDVKLCIQSIITKTNLNYRIIIVNDGSKTNVSNYLKQIANKHDNVILLENKAAQGYTKAANKGMKFSDADYVILLNSDTVVSTNWLENIINCGESNSKIGLIGPLSNAASYQSVPKIKNSSGKWAVNKLPEEYSIDDMAKIISRISQKSYPSVPVLNGFCLAIKRPVINSIGYFDEETFPQGYGEENDYCLRATNAGYLCVVSDNTYVYHSKSKSFGHSQRSNLSQQGWDALKNKHGADKLSKTLDELETNNDLKNIRNRLSVHLNNITECTSNENIEKEIKEIPDNYIRIFVISKNIDSTKISKTLNSINKIDKNLPVTIISSKTNNIPQNNNVEISTYNESEGFIKKINSLLNEKKEEFILFIDSGNELNKGAIEALNEDITKIHYNDKIAAIVFDDNIYNSNNILSRFKPGFSPEYYLEYDYIENSLWIRRNILSKIGGFNEKYKQNYIRDAIFRIWAENYEIIKKDIIGLNVLANNSSNKPEELKYFLENTLNRNNKLYTLKTNGNSLRPVYDTESAFVSIIIPFKDQANVTKKCIDSILKLTEYKDYELILINNNSIEKATKDFINKVKENEKIRVLDYAQPFNYSKMNNFAVKHARGNVLLFLNNDTEVNSSNWLNELVGDAIQSGVGAVGGLLFYPDGTIQHAGVVVGLNGLAGHLFAGENEKSLPSEWINYRRNVSAVTGACMAINRKTFEEIGGFNEEFDITGSDVEICLRLLENGYRNIINPEARLVHHEKKTRNNIRVRDKDIRMSLVIYQPYIENGDPYFNKNFSLNSTNLSVRKEEEYPLYQEFIDKYFEEKLNHEHKLSKLISHDKNYKPQNNLPDNEVLLYDVSPLELEKNQELMAKFKRNPKLQLKKTLWFIPFFDHVYRGGIYTIFRTAQHFSIKEGTNNIIVLYGRGERKLNEIENELIAAFPNLNFELINLNENGDVTDLPYSDAAFCTLWNSAYHLVKYNNCKAKFYFNQDFEPMFYSAGSIYGLIEQTYRFGFIGITNTIGVAEAHKKYNNWVTHFTPAVDGNIFYPNNNKTNKDKWRVVFYGRPNNPRNGFRLGIEALRLVKSYFGDKVEILSVGGEFDKNRYALDGVIENLGLLPTIDDVAELYRTCDVGLVFMFTPHPSYQPLEYMASGCATVTNINESNLWILRDKENAILTEPTVSCVANNIIDVLENNMLRNTIIENGLKTISSTNWENELNKIYEFVKNPKIKWEQ